MNTLPESVEKTVVGLGYELVDVVRHQGGKIIQVFIDKPEGITIDDCALVSNQLTHLFTVENIDYDRLEISSPGLDRVLKKAEDFIRFANSPVKLKLRATLPEWGNQKNFNGILKGLNNDTLMVDIEGKVLAVPLTNVEKVRLNPDYQNK